MKAILVIDMPKNCNKCKLKTHRFSFTTNKMKVGCKFKGDILTDVLSDRPNWCPLKPMPSKMKVEYETIAACEVTEKVVAMGWNACIETILGGEV